MTFDDPDFEWILRSPEGRRFIRGLFAFCGFPNEAPSDEQAIGRYNVAAYLHREFSNIDPIALKAFWTETLDEMVPDANERKLHHRQ